MNITAMTTTVSELNPEIASFTGNEPLTKRAPIPPRKTISTGSFVFNNNPNITTTVTMVNQA